ncbi:unnamed protein product, partial [marine sediment metagenome]
MTKQKQTIQLSRFSSGIITEADPLNQPPGSSIDEYNMDLLNDGTRKRRLGMECEIGCIPVPIDPSLEGQELAYNTYKWDLGNVRSGYVFTVVQTGNVLEVFRYYNNSAITANKVGSLALSEAPVNLPFSFSSVDDSLVVATGGGVYRVFDDTPDEEQITLASEEINLEVRDLFGLTDNIVDRDTSETKRIDLGNNIAYRPYESEMTDVHYYNLYNQGWPQDKV